MKLALTQFSNNEQFGITRLLCRLNQDHVEQTFSVIRSMGGQYTQFGGLEFIRRIRNFCLMSGGNLSVEAANVKPTEECNFKMQDFFSEDFEDFKDEVVRDHQANLEFDDILDAYEDVDFDFEEPEPQSSQNNDIETNNDLEPNIDLEPNNAQQMETDNVGTDMVETFSLNDWLGDTIRVDGISKETLADDMEFMNNHFEVHHTFSDNGLLRTKRVTADLVEKLMKLPRLSEYDPKLIKRFVVARTRKRIKYVYSTKIQHIKSARGQKKVIDLVQTQAASELTTHAATKVQSKAAKKKPVKRLKK